MHLSLKNCCALLAIPFCIKIYVTVIALFPYHWYLVYTVLLSMARFLIQLGSNIYLKVLQKK